MARAPKRLPPKYVPFEHGGVNYVVDLANREVLENYVAVKRQLMPAILSACLRAQESEAQAVAV